MIRIIKKPTDTPGDNSTEMVAESLRKRGIVFDFLDLDDIDIFNPGIEDDLIWVCGIRQDEIQFEAISALELNNTVVNSPQSIAVCASKVQTSARLIRKDVPTPQTIFTNSISEVEKFLERHEKAVFKPVYGFDGNGIFTFTETSALGEGPYYIQEFVENDCDYRVFVIGDKVAGAIRRSSDSFAHNIHQGGTGEAVLDIPEEMERIAVDAAASVGTDYCGVDLLPSGDSYLVLEVNGTPNWHCMGVPIPDFLADYLIDKEMSLKA